MSEKSHIYLLKNNTHLRSSPYSKINSERSKKKAYLSKMLKTKDEGNLETKEKWFISYKGNSVRFTADFSAEIVEAWSQ